MSNEHLTPEAMACHACKQTLLPGEGNLYQGSHQSRYDCVTRLLAVNESQARRIAELEREVATWKDNYQTLLDVEHPQQPLPTDERLCTIPGFTTDDDLMAVADKYDSQHSAGAIHRYHMRLRDMLALLRLVQSKAQEFERRAALPPKGRKVFTCRNCEAVYDAMVSECDCTVGVKHGFEAWVLVADRSPVEPVTTQEQTEGPHAHLAEDSRAGRCLPSSPSHQKLFSEAYKHARAIVSLLGVVPAQCEPDETVDRQCNHAARYMVNADGTCLLCGEDALALCEGCPPVGHPTDETRCDECPHRSQPETSEAQPTCSIVDNSYR